jgi:hypothetical protein
MKITERKRVLYSQYIVILIFSYVGYQSNVSAHTIKESQYTANDITYKSTNQEYYAEPPNAPQYTGRPPPAGILWNNIIELTKDGPKFISVAQIEAIFGVHLIENANSESNDPGHLYYSGGIYNYISIEAVYTIREYTSIQRDPTNYRIHFYWRPEADQKGGDPFIGCIVRQRARNDMYLNGWFWRGMYSVSSSSESFSKGPGVVSVYISNKNGCINSITISMIDTNISKPDNKK